MYTDRRFPGKFETWESQMEGEIVAGREAAAEWSPPSDGYVDWYGLVEGRRTSWIVHEDNDGFFVLVDRGRPDAMRDMWSGIVLGLEEDFYGIE